MITITKRFKMSIGHRLWNDNLTTEENKKIFGKCTKTHGHNVVLEVTVSGRIDINTGMVMNFNELKKIVNKLVVEKFDHQFVNDIEVMKGVIPTSENMIRVMWYLIRDELPSGVKLKKIRLYETDDSWCDYYE